MKLLKIILCASMLAGTPAAYAADKAGRFSVRGVGSGKCSDLLTAVSSKDRANIQLYSSWLSGYLSASNRLVAQTFDVVPAATANEVLGLIFVVCSKTRDSLVETAAHQALEFMYSIRVQEESALISVEGADRDFAIPQATLLYVQTELSRLALYDGVVDGKSSKKIVQAIRSFQQVEKLPVSGLPDIDVLIRLKLAAEKDK